MDSAENEQTTPPEKEETPTPETAVEEKEQAKLCPECSRPVSKKNGKCYYCSEPDAETMKKLKFAMLDWQRDEALDKEGQKRDKLVRAITFFHMLVASSCVAMTFAADFPPNITKWFYFSLGLFSAVAATKFTETALALVLTILLHVGIALSFFNLAMNSLKADLLITACLSGVVTGFAATISAAITLQILRNKTLEL